MDKEAIQLALFSAVTEIRPNWSSPLRVSTINSLSHVTWSRSLMPRSSGNSSSGIVKQSREACAKPTGKNLMREKGIQTALSESVRTVIRLVSSRKWSPEEIKEAFSEPVKSGEGRRGNIPTRPFQGSA
jgi:hypothetical protein